MVQMYNKNIFTLHQKIKLFINNNIRKQKKIKTKDLTVDMRNNNTYI